MVKSPARRAAVDYLQSTYEVSNRRACLVIQWCRESYAYKSKLNPANEVMRGRIREIATTRVRYGWRRILVLMRREGYPIGESRLRRLYTLEGLNLRAKTPKRRRSAAVRQGRVEATVPNQVWSMDFMHDRLVDGSKYRLLNIVDVFTRECIALRVERAFRSEDVTAILRRAIVQHGKPEAIRCDNGTEFTALAVDQWAYWNRVTLDFSRPGKPTDNAYW
jgi:putative transposase